MSWNRFTRRAALFAAAAGVLFLGRQGAVWALRSGAVWVPDRMPDRSAEQVQQARYGFTVAGERTVTVPEWNLGTPGGGGTRLSLALDADGTVLMVTGGDGLPADVRALVQKLRFSGGGGEVEGTVTEAPYP